MDFSWLTNLDWTMVDAIIHLLELLVMMIPAIAVFIYYKFNSLKLYIKEVTRFGAIIIVHNKSNKTIFLTETKIASKKSTDSSLEHSILLSPTNIDSLLKPDACTEITLNCDDVKQNKIKCLIAVKYNFKKTKKIKVTIK